MTKETLRDHFTRLMNEVRNIAAQLKSGSSGPDNAADALLGLTDNMQAELNAADNAKETQPAPGGAT